MNSGLRGCGTSECRHVLRQDSGSAHVLLFITLQQGGYTCWTGAVYVTSMSWLNLMMEHASCIPAPQGTVQGYSKIAWDW